MNAQTVCIEARDLSFSYGKKPVLFDVSLNVDLGSRIGIVGESGSGKSTLARLLVGLLQPQSGSVTINGSPWSRVGRGSRLRRSVQLIQQDPYAQLSPHIRVQSAIAEAARVALGVSRSDAWRLAGDLAQSVGIGAGHLRRRPSELSGGQCQRIAIARALAVRPSIIVADEPTSALDLSVQAQILNLLLELMTTSRLGLVLVSHDLAVVRHLADYVLVMRNGRIVDRGATAEVLDCPRHPYTRELCEATLSPYESSLQGAGIGLPAIAPKPEFQHGS